MATPDYDLPPRGPLQNAAENGPAMAEAQRRGRAVGNGGWPGQSQGNSNPRTRHERRAQTVNKTRNGGGFNPSLNITPSVNITKNATGPGPATTAGPAGAATTNGASGTPGSSFMSNEDIHAFAEHIRKEGRKRATLRAMDAEQLEAVLRTIPDLNGSIGGARMRARRVSRHLKRIAKAEQLIAKEGTALYAAFEREYEANLRTVGKGRLAPPPRSKFNWR